MENPHVLVNIAFYNKTGTRSNKIIEIYLYFNMTFS